MRLMGKRQIGELEVTDLVATLLLSEIASLPITDPNIPVLHALVPMIVLLSLEVFSSYILIRVPKLKNFLSAAPTILIKIGILDQLGKICAVVGCSMWNTHLIQKLFSLVLVAAVTRVFVFGD